MSSFGALEQQRKEEEIRLRLQALRYEEQQRSATSDCLKATGVNQAPFLPLSSAPIADASLSHPHGMHDPPPPSYASVSADAVPYGHPSLALRGMPPASALPARIAAEKQQSLTVSLGSLPRQLTSDIEVEAKLLKLGLVRYVIPPDGACMFRAISHHLYGTGVRHQEVREAAVRKILEMRDYFEPFMDYSGSGGAAMDGSRARTLPRYCKAMLMPDSWGGNLELQALAFAYNIQIQIYSARAEVVTVGEDEGEEKRYRLWYSHGNHYDCVFTEQRHKNMKFCQAIVADLVHMLFDEHYDQHSVLPFKNYDMEEYRRRTALQADEDSRVALEVSGENSVDMMTTEEEDMALALALARQEEEDEIERRRNLRLQRDMEVQEQKELAQKYGPAYWEQRKAEEFYSAQKNGTFALEAEKEKKGSKKGAKAEKEKLSPRGKKGEATAEQKTSPRGIASGFKLPKFFKRGKKPTTTKEVAPSNDDMVDVHLG